MDGIALVGSNPTDRIALRGVRLMARLAGMSQKTTLEQTFVNQEDRAIEAVYAFPLPEGAAVCHFEVLTADRVLTGKVEETEKAIDEYDQAIGEGHGAFLMEQDRPDVFTVRVGNIKPKQAATIRLTYVAPLEASDRTIRLAFPTTIAPRYATDTGGDDPLQNAMDGDALNPPHVLSVPYGLTMQVDVELGSAVESVSSPSHAIRVEDRDQDVKRITLTAGKTEMNRDIVLVLQLKKEQKPHALAVTGKNGESYLAVTFVPEFDVDDLSDPLATETIFLLDCSGSMMGGSIQQAVAALELCLRSLSPGDSFNICCFGSTFQLLASEPLVYSEETLRRALAFVHQSADLGGTELYAPLLAIFSRPPVVGAVRQIILLTDGQVTNEPQILALARQQREHNRIFTFGIGSACSAFLVRGLARATRGAAEFISASERIEDKVLRTFSRIASPGVRDVQLDWGNADVQTLAEIPPVFDGEVLAIFGRSAGKAPEQVTLRCTTGAGPRAWTMPVQRIPDAEGLIATMWARRMIQSLEEVNDIRRTSVSARKSQRDHQTLISLSKEFNLLCSLTTFIAIEHRSVEERNEGAPELRRVPVVLSKGWGGIDAGSAANMAMPMAAPSMLARGPSLAAQIAKPGIVARFRRALVASRDSDRPRTVPPDALELGESTPARPRDGLQDMLSLQSADGWFDDDNVIDQVLTAHDVNPVTWRSAIDSAIHPIMPRDFSDSDRLTRTLLVLLILKLLFPARSALWRRAARKALAWSAKALAITVTQLEVALDKAAKNLKPSA